MKERPDSESKEAGKDAESDEEVKKGSKKELPGGLQHKNHVGEFYFFKLIWRRSWNLFKCVLHLGRSGGRMVAYKVLKSFGRFE